MKPETLKEFKQRARKFANLYQILDNHWNGQLERDCSVSFPVTVLINILVSNIAFDASDTHNYDHHKAVDEVKDILKVLKAIDEYENYIYMTHYPYMELSLLYEGLCHSEDF